MSHDALVATLARLANASLSLWDLEAGATARLINLSENATYLVETPSGGRTILRIHREGYHSRRAIECELAWLEALRTEGGVITPHAIPGRDGEIIQIGRIDALPTPRHMVLFEFIEGEEPDEKAHDLRQPFIRLGEITARIHRHSETWARPQPFERLTWDYEHILGAHPYWGDWRAAPAMDPAREEILTRQQDTIRRRLESYGMGPHRYGLIHADLRLANLLVSGDSTRVIDFDDCGFGWYLYDLATAFSFFEDNPQVPELTRYWLEGYLPVRNLDQADIDEIPTFIMLRRMALLAWIGSHSETELAQEMGPEFTRVSCELAEDYLTRFG
ncbi:MAG: aminoglycoside phosphotransferase [Alphaproteobacteria bacterium]|nr:MAG: aminoglycoside phosphotransferase [Alphaproteobacteria bacterium]